MMLPKTGHTINLEEPAAFNAAVENFINAVEHGRWNTGVTVAGKGYTLLPQQR
jgi:hypothetical protein